MWRSWTMPGCSAMQRNHWPPSLTTVVPASTPEHRCLVSPARKPRTTCKRAWSGRPSSEVSIATIKGVWRIASPGMFLEAEPLPHLICSRPMFIGGVKDEADQHGDAGRVGGSDSGAIFAGGQDGAEPYPRRVHGSYGLSPQARDAAPSGGSTESALWPTTWAADL